MPTPGDLPDLWMEPESFTSPALAPRPLPLASPGNPTDSDFSILYGLTEWAVKYRGEGVSTITSDYPEK